MPKPGVMALLSRPLRQRHCHRIKDRLGHRANLLRYCQRYNQGRVLRVCDGAKQNEIRIQEI